MSRASLRRPTGRHILLAALAVPAVAAGGWVLTLPDRAACRASGRVVDPTERHCLSPAGYEQLREHAAFHGAQVALAVLAVAAAAWVVHRVVRRRSR